jgi:transposase
MSKRLDAIPVASVADPTSSDRYERIGLVLKQHSSGGGDKLGSIRKKGDRYLRSLFINSTHAP